MNFYSYRLLVNAVKNELPINYPWKHVVRVNILTPICCYMLREIKAQALLLLYKLISLQKIIEAHVSIFYHFHSLYIGIVLLDHMSSFICLAKWLVFVSTKDDFEFMNNSDTLYEGRTTLNLDYIAYKILVPLKASSQACTARQLLISSCKKYVIGQFNILYISQFFPDVSSNRGLM